jgi:hypothetical protein
MLVKCLSHYTSFTLHSIVGYPNMTGAISLSRPSVESSTSEVVSSKMDSLANASNTNISIKAIQNAARLFTDGSRCGYYRPPRL